MILKFCLKISPKIVINVLYKDYLKFEICLIVILRLSVNWITGTSLSDVQVTVIKGQLNANTG